MNHTQILAATFALIAFATPLSANAKDAPTVVGTSKPRENESGQLSWISDRTNAASVRTGRASAPFRLRLLARAATVKSRGFAHEWGNGSLSLSSMRTKSARSGEGITPFSFNRFSTWSADVGLVQDVSSHDSLSFGASYTQERRRPSFSVAAHNAYKTNDAAITLGWTHDESFRLSASLYSIEPNGVRSMQERIVELAGGAPLAARGIAVIANFSPNHDPDKFSFGVDLRSQRLDQSDTGLIGVASGSNDARIGLFLRKAF